MGFGDAVKTCLSKFANGTGRAARPEYWYFFLFCLIVDLVASGIDAAAGSTFLGTIAGLAMLCPSVAAGIRRLHDTDRVGWWLLLGVVPVVGWIIVIIWLCAPGTPGPNRFGAASESLDAGAMA